MKLQTIFMTGFLMVSQFATTQEAVAQSAQCGQVAYTNIKRYYEQSLVERNPGHRRVFVQGFQQINAAEGIQLVNASDDLSASEKQKALADLRNTRNSVFKFITATRTDSRLKLTLSDSKCQKVNTYTLDYQ